MQVEPRELTLKTILTAHTGIGTIYITWVGK